MKKTWKRLCTGFLALIFIIISIGFRQKSKKINIFS